jgi:NADH-quinone oxidoreductase subunit A
VQENFLSLFIYLFLVLSVVLVMLGSYFLGPKQTNRASIEPYEGGITSANSSFHKLTINFYFLAVCFVIFDVESVFIYSWALAAKELGETGYITILIFILMLFVALFYLWGNGLFEFKTAKAGNSKKVIKHV